MDLTQTVISYVGRAIRENEKARARYRGPLPHPLYGKPVGTPPSYLDERGSALRAWKLRLANARDAKVFIYLRCLTEGLMEPLELSRRNNNDISILLHPDVVAPKWLEDYTFADVNWKASYIAILGQDSQFYGLGDPLQEEPCIQTVIKGPPSGIPVIKAAHCLLTNQEFPLGPIEWTFSPREERRRPAGIPEDAVEWGGAYIWTRRLEDVKRRPENTTPY